VFPLAILTDGDAAKIGDPPSVTASGLKAKEAEIPKLRVECSEITFEHELARSAAILPLMLDALEIIHPINGANLKTTVAALDTDDKKADAFLAEFLRSKTSKGQFAQELAAFTRPHIAERIAKRFPEIVIDEAQDTNVWLLIMLNFLRERGTKVTLIGDPDQCIYAFAMAATTSLPELKEKWKIPERPLSQSFRCNNQIAAAVRNIGGNPDFVGCGDGDNEHRRPFVIKDTAERFTHTVAEFERALDRARIAARSSAIICRAHHQLESIRGEVNYTKLKGITKELAEAAFLRDCRKDYKRAFQIVERFVRSVVEDSAIWERIDEFPESEEAQRVKLVLWRFVKSQSGLPSVALSGSEWISRLRENLGKLLAELAIINPPNLNLKIKKTGLDDDQLKLPLFEGQALFPPIRQETIHQVKGESIDGVLVLGSTRFWNSVVDSVAKGENSEDRRLAYVAMTRARHLLLVGLPASHFDKHVEEWVRWGFTVL
jgi:superfamily I DNA/RNA helicase